jgi:GntR family transcriptional repressor for pyruvate dehydrogenase complex
MPKINTGVSPVQRLKLSDAVAAQLEDLVRSGHFGAEGKIPSERDLAEQFGVGRSSMREAVSKLETLGIIMRTHGVGTFAIDVSEQSQNSMSLLSAGEVTTLELFTVRYALEPLGASMAAARRTNKDIQELKSILKEAASADISSKEFVRLDGEFHRLLAKSTKNRLFIQLYNQITPHHNAYSEKVILIKNRQIHAHESHLRILQAVIDQDESLAKKEAYAHLRSAERDLVKEIDRLDIKKKPARKLNNLSN